MSDTLDFFDRLEGELRRAASRRVRRRLTAPPPAVLVAALAIGALALIPIALLGGDEPTAPSRAGPSVSPVGTVLSKGSGSPPLRHTSMVVARDERSPVGPWQLEVYRYGSPHPRAAEARPGHCLMLYLPATPGDGRPGRGGYCSPRRRKLGARTIPVFGMAESMLPPRRPRMVVVFGRAPLRASKVVVTFPERRRVLAVPRPAPPGFERRYGFDASFFALVLRTTAVDGARVNWVDAAGRAGSRGLPLYALGPPRP